VLRFTHKPGQTEGGSPFERDTHQNVTIPGSNPARIGSETTQSYSVGVRHRRRLKRTIFEVSAGTFSKAYRYPPIQSVGLYDRAYAPLQMNTDGCMWGGDSQQGPARGRDLASCGGFPGVPHLKSAWRSPKGAETPRYQVFSVRWAVNRQAKSSAPKHSEHPSTTAP
jgi:hypothetical protein